jgi:hypothetical protein
LLLDGGHFSLICHVRACAVNAWVGWLEQNQIDQISLFMSTMDGVDSPATEGNQIRKAMMLAHIHFNANCEKKNIDLKGLTCEPQWDDSSSIWFSSYWAGRNATSPFFYDALRTFLAPRRHY